MLEDAAHRDLQEILNNLPIVAAPDAGEYKPTPPLLGLRDGTHQRPVCTAAGTGTVEAVGDGAPSTLDPAFALQPAPATVAAVAEVLGTIVGICAASGIGAMSAVGRFNSHPHQLLRRLCLRERRQQRPDNWDRLAVVAKGANFCLSGRERDVSQVRLGDHQPSHLPASVKLVDIYGGTTKATI